MNRGKALRGQLACCLTWSMWTVGCARFTVHAHAAVRPRAAAAGVQKDRGSSSSRRFIRRARAPHTGTSARGPSRARRTAKDMQLQPCGTTFDNSGGARQWGSGLRGTWHRSCCVHVVMAMQLCVQRALMHAAENAKAFSLSSSLKRLATLRAQRSLGTQPPLHEHDMARSIATHMVRAALRAALH